MDRKTSYNTKQKQIIYRFFEENREKQFSAKEIFESLKDDAEIGESTVYRLIKTLTDDGAIRRFNGKNTKSIVYQFAGKNEHCHEHLHLKCSDCGELIHLDCELSKEFEEHMGKHHGFLIDPIKTIFYGTCMECVKKHGRGVQNE